MLDSARAMKSNAWACQVVESWVDEERVVMRVMRVVLGLSGTRSGSRTLCSARVEGCLERKRWGRSAFYNMLNRSLEPGHAGLALEGAEIGRGSGDGVGDARSAGRHRWQRLLEASK